MRAALEAARKRRRDKRHGPRIVYGVNALRYDGAVIALRCNRAGYAERERERQAAEAAKAAEHHGSVQAVTRAANRRRVAAYQRRAEAGDGLTSDARAFAAAERAHASRIVESGTTATRAAMERLASDALEPARITAAERATVRAARRAAIKARRGETATLRPVYALRVTRSKGHGERSDVIAAGRLDAMSLACARSWVRAWLASGGRDIFRVAPGEDYGRPGDKFQGRADSNTEELARIFRAAFTIAAARSGYVAPDMATLFIQRTSNPLPFHALLAWRRACALAWSQCRSWMWGKGWERCQVASFSDVEALRAHFMGAPDGRCVTVSASRMSDAPMEYEVAREARLTLSPSGRAALARRVGHSADCLRVFWGLSGSREWRSSLARDLALLTLAARITRGGGWDGLDGSLVSGAGPDGAPASDGASCALRKRLQRLRERVGSGDVLMEEQPDAAESVLEVMSGAKQRKATVRRVAFVLDGDNLLPAAQVLI